MFSHRLPALERYAELLSNAGVVRGLIGPREVPRLWERHLINCAWAGRVMPAHATVADVGSGAGLPGLVLALDRSDLQLTLIEPLLRRATFLQEAVEELELSNVTVVRSRAEELPRGNQFDVVTSRAVAPLVRLASWCLPLVRDGGEMVAMKGSSAAREVGEASSIIRKYGGRDVRVEEHGEESEGGATEASELGDDAYALSPTIVVRIRH